MSSKPLSKQAADAVRGRLAIEGITAAELARRIGCTRANVSNGLRHGVATMYTLQTMATALGCRVVVRLEPIDSPVEVAP